MNNKRLKLINRLKRLPINMVNRLDELKAEEKNINRPDFIWHYILQSISTMGNSKPHKEMIINQENYSLIAYDSVKNLFPMERFNRFKNVMEKCGVEEAEKKAKWLCFNLEFLLVYGGAEKVKEIILTLNGKEEKVNYLIKNFKGIGSKYARNIFMDVYHPEFRDCVAIDYRINKITEKMGYKFETYEEHEKFYLDIAKESGLNGWELDRILYNFNNYFLKVLD